jgi:hypothetical protein
MLKIPFLVVATETQRHGEKPLKKRELCVSVPLWQTGFWKFQCTLSIQTSDFGFSFHVLRITYHVSRITFHDNHIKNTVANRMMKYLDRSIFL